MNNNPAVPVSIRFFCIAIILLLQLPAISPALDLARSAGGGYESGTPAAPFTVFTNAASISVADKAAAGPPNGISSPYPSQIAVSGLSGTVSDVNVTISGINANRPRDLEFALVSPTGQALKLMADAGDLTAMAGVVLTFDGAAATAVPTGGGSAIPTGTYRPTDFFFSAGDPEDFPAPGPAAPGIPAPTGIATLTSVFNGLSPNGNWSLFVIDDSLGGGVSTITSGWSIDITTAGGGVPTTTTVASNINPALTTQAVTFTSLTTSGGNPVTVGTVSFTNNGLGISECSVIAVNSSGNATCTTTLPEGTRTIGANYNGSGAFGISGGTMSQVVNSPTVVTGGQFCNNGGFTIVDPGSASVYPSNITISALTGTINTLTVQLINMNVPRTSNLDFLLVGPGGQAFQMMSDTGDAVTPVNPLTLLLADSAGSQLPTGTPVSSGTFRPTDVNVIGLPDTYPAPAPAVFSLAAPAGSSTFASVFNGLVPNGGWALYAIDDSVGGGTTTVASWCANFALTKFATTTTVASSQNPSLSGQPVTFTATVNVTAPGTGPATGTVEFFDGVASLGTGTLNGAGQVTLLTSALANGTRSITAQYLGANVGAGGGGFAVSTSGVLSQVVSNTAVWDGSASSDWNTPANWTTNLVPLSTHNVDLPSAGVTNQPNLSAANTAVPNLTVGANRTLTIGGGRTLTVNSTLTMTGNNIDATNGTLEIASGAGISRSSGVVLGNLRKNYVLGNIAPQSPAAIFVYPVGTATGFSPVTANVTAGSTGSLTIAAFNGTAPSTPPLADATTLNRYWQLTETGSLTADLTLNYLDPVDVDGAPGAEANYRLIRTTTGNVPRGFDNVGACPGGGSVCVNTAANTIFTSGVSDFNFFWTAGALAPPTAATVTVSGRVFGTDGRGLSKARITMTDTNGDPVYAVTNPFGYYRFSGIAVGQNYVVAVSSKSFVFTPRTISVADELADVDFVGIPRE